MLCQLHGIWLAGWLLNLEPVNFKSWEMKSAVFLREVPKVATSSVSGDNAIACQWSRQADHHQIRY